MISTIDPAPRRFRRESCISENCLPTFNIAKWIIQAEVLTLQPWPNSASKEKIISKAWKEGQNYLRRLRESLDGVEEGAYIRNSDFSQEIDSAAASVVCL